FAGLSDGTVAGGGRGQLRGGPADGEPLVSTQVSRAGVRNCRRRKLGHAPGDALWAAPGGEVWMARGVRNGDCAVAGSGGSFCAAGAGGTRRETEGGAGGLPDGAGRERHVSVQPVLWRDVRRVRRAGELLVNSAP